MVYVTKDRETLASAEVTARRRAMYQAVARQCGVYVHVVERLPPRVGEAAPRRPKSHSALGRDDFYLIMLAWRYRCPVLSQDRFRDLPDMKGGLLDPFHVFSYPPGTRPRERDFVNPAAPEFGRMRRPVALEFAEVLKHA